MIMRMVAAGASRQDARKLSYLTFIRTNLTNVKLDEEIRVLSHQASDVVKNEGGKVRRMLIFHLDRQ